MFAIAVRCFESGAGLETARRRFRERLATGYFWDACGIVRPDRRVERMRPGSERTRSLTSAPGEKGR